MITPTARAIVVSTSVIVALILALTVFKERGIAKWGTEFDAFVVVKLTPRFYADHRIVNR